MADPRLPAWAVRLIDELNASDRRAIELAGALSREQLNWKPTADVWSVGQCLQHLHATNEVYVPAIARALNDRKRSTPVQDIRPGWFGRWFIRTYIEPSSRGRARAPGKIAPALEVDPSVLDLFLRSNEAVRDLIRRAGGCDINRIRFVNPFIPLLRFSVATGLEIVWKHQRRHLLQAERIKQTSGFPRPEFR